MIDWLQIETVLLDMDGTLLDLHFDNYFWTEYLPQHYACLNDLSYEDSRQMLIDRFSASRGQLNFYCIEHWSQELDIDLMPIKAQLKHRIKFLPGALALLEHLQSLPTEIVLVTNAHQQVLNLKHEVVNIKSHVDAAYASHEFGLPKEDPSFWQAFADSHPFNPEKTVLVDDNQAVLSSAAQFNIATLIQPLKPDSKQPVSAREANSKFLQIAELTELLAPA